jgi:YidC/Oxa1 family membrane protein insertase
LGDNRRVLVATVLSVAILILWQVVFPPPKRPAAPPPPPATEAAKTEAGKPATPPAPGTAAPAAPAVPPPPPSAPEERITLKGNGFVATFTSHGGALESFVLEGEKFRRTENGKDVQVDLVRVEGSEGRPFATVASPELGGSQDAASDRFARAPMRIVSRSADAVTFEGRVGTVEVKKTFRLTGKPYELAAEVAISGAPGGGTVSVLFPGYTPPSASKGSMFSGPPLDVVHPVCRAGGKTERFDLGGKDAGAVVPGAVEWIGLDVGYFVLAAIPPQPAGACAFARGSAQGTGLAALVLPADASGRSLSLTVYAGPKDLDVLRAYGQGLDTAINYNFMARPFAFFARILLYVMRWFYELLGNWGVAIILLTVLVKVLLFPLTVKQVASMNEMRKLQPEIEKLKAKFANDRDKLNMATMELYRQHKVNPLGGCLPMLLQLPIWFALYATLQTSVELYREPFLWMKDLTQHDPFFILPIAMGVSSFVMQKLSPQPADNTQAKMMLYFMPGFFTILMLFVPGGLTLYIFVNNILSIAQQQYISKRQAVAAATPK